MNGKHEVDAEEYAAGSNILIGGNTLGRGVTFGGLHTIFIRGQLKSLRLIRCGSIAECLAMTGIQG